MKILGIDWGEKRVGFAIGYSHNRMVFPLGGIDRRDNRTLLSAIRGIMADHGIEKIVIGYPLDADGAAGATCRKIDRFISFLGRRLSVPMEKVDEHLTSWEAEATLKALKKKGSRRRELADGFAAESIVRTYLGKK